MATVFAASPGRAGPPEKSVVLRALEEEMQRSKEGLKAKGDPTPYFISYCVTEREGVRISVSRGALRHRSTERSRLLDVEVRVGDYAFDSTRRLRGERGFFPGRLFRAVRLPLEDDLLAMRQAIWLETDRRYRDAVESFIQVKTNAELKAKEAEVSADFSKESPERYLGPVPRLAVDADGWERRLKEVSRTFQSYPLI
jgi:TldD protein